MMLAALPPCLVRAALLLSLIFPIAQTALGFGGYTALGYSQGLSGYSETWADPFDIGEENCEYIELGYYTCEGYALLSVHVQASLHAPGGSVADYGYGTGPWYAYTYVGAGAVPGVWTAIGQHSADMRYYAYYCAPYQGCGGYDEQQNEYLGQTGAQVSVPPPVCSLESIDQAAVGAVLQWPMQEPWERGVMIFCGTPPSTFTFGYYGDSFGQFYGGAGDTNDPCAIEWNLSVPANLAAVAHAHPWFDDLQEYQAGDNCLGDTAYHTRAEIMTHNTSTNVGASDADQDLSDLKDVPVYTRSPAGTEVRRYWRSAPGPLEPVVYP